jgi:hypothetical protein
MKLKTCSSGQTLNNTCIFCLFTIIIGHALAQLNEVLRYKPGGRGFVSRCCNRNFSLHNRSDRTMTLWSKQPLTEMITSYNFRGKGGRCVGLTTSTP